MTRRRRQTSILGLPSDEANQALTPHGSLTLPISGDSLTREEERTLEEYRKQWLVLQATKSKSALAMTAVKNLEEHSVGCFVEAADTIEAHKMGDRDPEHQAYIDEFCNRSKKATANHLLAFVELGARALAEDVVRPIYLMPEPPTPVQPEKPSFLEWFFS